MSHEQPQAPEERIAQLEQENAALREENARLTKERDEREREALVDDLTKVLNRRGLNEMAKVLLPRREAATQDPSKPRERKVVGMFDLDNFKQLNTEHGHIKADEVLKRAAQVLRGFVRESDVVARFGGEEFVVIFTNASGENIKTRLFDENEGRWKMGFSTLVDGEEIRTSFSGGITEIGANETVNDLQTILERADRALRHSKDTGKNRVTDLDKTAQEG